MFNVSNRACIIESNYIYTICVQDKNYARQFIITFHRPWTFRIYFTLTQNVARKSIAERSREMFPVSSRDVNIIFGHIVIYVQKEMSRATAAIFLTYKKKA